MRYIAAVTNITKKAEIERCVMGVCWVWCVVGVCIGYVCCTSLALVMPLLLGEGGWDKTSWDGTSVELAAAAIDVHFMPMHRTRGCIS